MISKLNSGSLARSRCSTTCMNQSFVLFNSVLIYSVRFVSPRPGSGQVGAQPAPRLVQVRPGPLGIVGQLVGPDPPQPEPFQPGPFQSDPLAPDGLTTTSCPLLAGQIRIQRRDE